MYKYIRLEKNILIFLSKIFKGSIHLKKKAMVSKLLLIILIYLSTSNVIFHYRQNLVLKIIRNKNNNY